MVSINNPNNPAMPTPLANQSADSAANSSVAGNGSTVTSAGAASAAASISDSYGMAQGLLSSLSIDNIVGPVATPAASLSGDVLLGAESFAAQVSSMSDSGDITAEFLKMGIIQDTQEGDAYVDLAKLKSDMRQHMNEAAASHIESSDPYMAYYCHQMAEMMGSQAGSMRSDYTEMVQEKIRESMEGQMNGEEDKSVDQSKREAKLKRKGSGKTAVAGADGAQEVSTMMSLFALEPKGNRLIPGLLAMDLGAGARASAPPAAALSSNTPATAAASSPAPAADPLSDEAPAVAEPATNMPSAEALSAAASDIDTPSAETLSPAALAATMLSPDARIANSQQQVGQLVADLAERSEALADSLRI